MNCKLDWFSFTFPITLLGENDNEYTVSHIISAFHEHTGRRLLGVVTDALWSWVQSAGFYDHRIQCPNTLCAISWRAGNPYALCEFSGQSVDLILQAISVSTLASTANGRATRLDFAVDIETDVQPKAFSEVREIGRITTSGFIQSPTGDTYYIGSRKGDRMARVYRFAPPHPRSGLLRIESENKGATAKILCAALETSSLTLITLQSHLPFGWKHDIWKPDIADVSKLPARAYDSDGAGTLRWLNLTVVPAIKKAAESGLIDLSDWLSDHFNIDV